MLRIIRDPKIPIVNQEQSFVPLKRVNVDAKLRAFAADVTITQVFRNDETKPIEAVYCFPIEEQAAIYSFTARIDDREIVAQLKEKKEAQKEYTQALQQGHGAYLMEQDEKSQDNFIINVGALPPSKECTITIAYVSELDFVQGSIIRFVVPTTIAPRYNPEKGGVASPAGTTSKYVQSSPYTIEFRCQVDKMGRSEAEYITRINSPSHPIQVDFAQQDAYVVTFAQQNTHLDRDILINIELANQRTNTIVAVESGAVMAAFVPKEEDCRGGATGEQVNEFVFVVDCSGSMQDENKIGLARQAMLVFLKSLPFHCHFNIVRFGSSHQSLFPQVTAIYDEENARKAEQLINGMKADLGGTELMRPLKWLEEHRAEQGRARQVFLLTDGEISNVTEVLDLCRSMATSTRIFSFGLGKSPSRSLVKGLARATNGRFVFIPPNASVDIYVGEQLQKAPQPCLTNVEVKWNLGVEVQHAPKQTPPVYLNDRLVVYALTNDKNIAFDHNSSVELQVGPDHRSVGVARVNQIPSISVNGTIARLAAKALILELQHAKLPSATANKPSSGSTQARFKDLAAATPSEVKVDVVEDAQSAKQRIIDLSLKYNILSPHTAFVGIEKRTNGNNAEMVLREVPIEISADDQHLIGRSFGGAVRHSKVLSAASGSASGFLGGLGFGRKQRISHAAASTIPMASNSSYSTLDKWKAQSANRDIDADSMYGIMDECCSAISAPVPRMSSSSSLRSNVDSQRELEEWCSDAPSSSTTVSSNLVWPKNDQDIVRHLINQQKFDGLWNADDTIVNNLTGKSLTSFRTTLTNVSQDILASAIIIIVLETKYSSFSSLWHGVVQKARKRINDLLKKDSNNVDALIDDIRKQI